ncbi:histidine phosphatase family protein [Lentibacillus sp. N15]|uniref:histidine phosphatase family protein n=1 Tax=Lentibacillus songyuanensis TaxID=3136161 RepID=UPI0031BAA1E2
MFNHSNTDIDQSSYQFAQMGLSEHLETTSANYPSLFYHRSLMNSLREGGYILYARHGEATVGEDQRVINFQDCSTQRNLSEDGRKQAIAYGEKLYNLRIPVGYPVLTSPFCRARQTGELAFGKKIVQIDPFWFEIYKLSGNVSEMEQERILNSFKLALEIQPLPGYNQVIIAHSFPEEIGLGEIPNMGTVIVKPYGPGNGYEVIARISLEDW